MLDDLCTDEGVPAFAHDTARLWTTKRLETSAGVAPDQLKFNLPHPINEQDDVPLAASFTRVINLMSPEAKQLRNVIVKRALTELAYPRMGSMFLDMGRQHELSDLGLYIWQGYEPHVITSQTDQTHMRVLFMTRVLQRDTLKTRLDNLMKRVREPASHRPQFEESLVDQTVVTRYNTDRIYRIRERPNVEWNLNPDSKLETQRGGDTTYRKYTCSKYPAVPADTIDGRQPMIVAWVKNRLRTNAAARDSGQSGEGVDPYQKVHLIPQFCLLTGIPESIARDYGIRKRLEPYIRPVPSQQIEAMRSFLTKLNATAKMIGWKMSFSLDMLPVPAKIYPAGDVRFVDGPVRVSQSASWNANGHVLVSKPPLNNWLVMADTRNEGLCREVLPDLLRAFMEFDVRPAEPKIIVSPSADTFQRRIEEAYSANLQMVVCLLPRDGLYASLKKFLLADFRVPIVSQCIKTSTLNERNPAKYSAKLSKIAMQIVCKLGGSLWKTELPLKDAMIVGIASHKSQLALCASRSADCTTYYTEVMARPTVGVRLGQSGSLDKDRLGSAFFRAMGKFAKDPVNKGRPPQTIIIYRDGVPEGELGDNGRVVREEVPIFLDMLRRTPVPNYSPNFVFLASLKRNDTRFYRQGYVAQPNETPSSANVPAGLKVDSIITQHQGEFFEVPHVSTIGAALATQYRIVYKSGTPDLEQVKLETYKLCEMYYNWTGTIRLPAPLMYALKCAKLVQEFSGGAATAFHNQAKQEAISGQLFQL